MENSEASYGMNSMHPRNNKPRSLRDEAHDIHMEHFTGGYFKPLCFVLLCYLLHSLHE